jgi:hypothetical protein
MQPQGPLCVHKIPTPVHIWSQMNPIYTLQPYFPKIQLILSSCPSFRLSNQNVRNSRLPHALYMPLLLIILIFGEGYNLWSSSYNFLQPHITSSLLSPEFLLSILFLKHPQSVFFL